METVVSALFGAVLEKLASAGVSQFMKLINKGKKTNSVNIIEEWKGELLFIQEMLNDAEQNHSNRGAVKLWLENLQDLAYDLEDTLDDFAEEALTHHLNTAQDDDDDDDDVDRLKKHGGGFLGLSCHNMIGSVLACGRGAARQFLYSGPDFSSKIDEISSRLKQLQTRMETLGLSAQSIQQPTYSSEGLHRGRLESTSATSGDIVYGRDEEKKEIIRCLFKDEPTYGNYAVIPVVGMGGIGKSTLAQYVYNDELVESHFDLKAWVCVSDVFDVKRIMTTIISSVTHNNVDFNDLDLAQRKLQQELTGKKFLLVLDDIWSEEYDKWDQLQNPFRLGARGSRVIVTTRNEKIANMVVNNYSHSNIIYLKCLSDEDCWCLFKRHAIEYTDLAERQDDIVKKCKGLPLAAKALGGLLRKTTVKSERLRILDSIIWNEESTVLPVLRLSYHHLPSHLKHLFAYCSVFPKDYQFGEVEVIKLWMAQGFLPNNENVRMEDKGHECFLDLASRSFFEEGRFNKFTMHDLIHDLAKWAAGDLCCVTDTMNMQKDLKRIRHLFITKNGIDETLGNQLLASRLRTFLCSSSYVLNIEILDYVQRFRYVRTLRLASKTIVELPECIGELKHLQFLALFLKRIKVLPKSIGKLWNLQTLECSCYKLQEVPNVRFLAKLRHLFVGGRSLQEMPQGISKLINLQHLNTFFLVAGRGSRVSDLKNLNRLHGELTISGLANVTKVEDAQESQLHKKQCLEELYLDWGTCRDEVDDNTKRDVLEKLQPHTSIKKCVLKEYRGLAFPGWLGDPAFTNMVDIKLEMCEKCEHLPPLGQLPLLKYLRVEGMNGIKEVGPEFYGRCSTPFPALRTLHFELMESWEKWMQSPVDNNRAFPCLEKLEVKHCETLQGDLPPLRQCLKTLVIFKCKGLSVSLPSLPSLEDLRVEGCKVLSTTANVIFCSKRMILRDILEITGLPGRISYLREKLIIENCESPPITIDQIPAALRRVKISHCREVQSLEFKDSSSPTTCLETLFVKKCQSIVYIDHIPLTLHSLKVYRCDELRLVKFEEPPEGFSGSETAAESVGLSPKASLELPLLTKLRIRKCPSLTSLHEGLLLPALENLEFYACENMERLPSQLHKFTSLKYFKIERCPKVSSLAEGGLPINLTSIWIQNVKIKQPVQDWGLHRLSSLLSLSLINIGRSTGLLDKPIQEWGLHLLISLQNLRLENVGSSADSVEYISDLHLSSSLSLLNIKGFKNLKTICCSTLPNLSKVYIKSCPKFESFGDIGLPSQLEYVYIFKCDLIEQHLTSDPDGRIHAKKGRYTLS